MKAWSVIGLLFAAAIFATIPVSTQVTPRGGVELGVDQAQAVTYRRARVETRRAVRHAPRVRRISAAGSIRPNGGRLIMETNVGLPAHRERPSSLLRRRAAI